jgi:hypothetical protein
MRETRQRERKCVYVCNRGESAKKVLVIRETVFC